jgi:hypothetical protein
MNTAMAQSTAAEDQVRGSVAQALVGHGGTVTGDQPGSLVVEVGGSKLSAYLAGGFRNKMKMPMLITVLTSGGPAGTGLSVEIRSRGTGSGAMSGGWLGASKQGKGEQAWMEIVMGAVPGLVGAPATVASPAPAAGTPPLAAPAPPGAQVPPAAQTPTLQAPPPQMPPPQAPPGQFTP